MRAQTDGETRTAAQRLTAHAFDHANCTPVRRLMLASLTSGVITVVATVTMAITSRRLRATL
jgi:hypothetical protein